MRFIVTFRQGRGRRHALSCYSHMLPHPCGFKLTHEGHDMRAIQEWLGPHNIQHTMRYTEFISHRFKRFLAGRGLTAVPAALSDHHFIRHRVDVQRIQN